MDNWNFNGALLENGNRVITKVEGSIKSDNGEEEGRIELNRTDDGTLKINIFLPSYIDSSIADLKRELEELKNNKTTTLENK